MTLRLLVVSNELPYPPTHGGRVDQWSRLRQFRRADVRLACVTWQSGDDALQKEQREALDEVFDDLLVLGISRRPAAMVRRLLDLPWHSPHVSTRIARGADLRRVLDTATRFGPNAIWLDGLYGGVTARLLSATMRLPVFYRSHNVEFKYIRSQARRARTLRDRVAWHLAALHLEAFETSIQRQSRIVFDISQDDLQFWRARGIVNNRWLPTLAPMHNALPVPFHDRQWDLVYLGNLSTPNNVEGLQWFAENVVRHLKRQMPQIRILVAGSRPTADVRGLLAAAGISVLENPPDAGAVLRQGRALINPILSGSGMNVKSVEMLNHEAAVITTTTGARGLGDKARPALRIADDAEGFAQLCMAALSTPFHADHIRIAARAQFAPDIIDAAVAQMTDALAPQA